MSKIITLGSDPELFTSFEGKLSSVAGKLDCDKYNKRTFSDTVRIQEDNVLIEFDINPNGTFEAFSGNLQEGLDACKAIAESVGHEIVPGVSSHSFTMEELNSFHKSAFVFGCESDMNALTGMVNPKPTASDPGLRTAGGHVHIGYADAVDIPMEYERTQSITGVMCDYFLGLWSLLVDKDDRRRELYGKAGAIRTKSYGIEYRTLSNFWVFDPANRKIVWDQSHKVVDSLKTGRWNELAAIVDPREVQRVINTGDKWAAERYLTLLKVM